MFKPAYITLLVLAMLSACRSSEDDEGQKAAIGRDSLQVARLLFKGKNTQNLTKDSILIVANQLEQASKAAKNKTGIIYADAFKARYYWYAVDYANGMKHAVRALANAEAWKLHEPIPGIYSIMANIHKENGNYEAAFKDCDRGLQQARLNKDTLDIISLLGQNAMFTHSYYLKKGHPDDDKTSLQMQFDGLELAEANPKYERLLIPFYDNIAQTLKERKQYDQAIVYAKKGVALAYKYHQSRSLTYGYNWLGEAYYYSGQHEKGMVCLDSALSLATSLGMLYREMELNETMHKCYMSTKNYEPAIISLRRFEKMRDSLQIAKNEKQVSELQLKYETEKKDREIATLDKQNQVKSRKIWLIFGSLIFFVGLVFIILYQYILIRRKNRQMVISNAQLNTALMQIAHIQSHHIRQPLASIMGLMNVIKAEDYEADKEVLEKMDEVTHDLDKRIRDLIGHAEGVE